METFMIIIDLVTYINFHKKQIHNSFSIFTKIDLRYLNF
jgi:hypothetical protein